MVIPLLINTTNFNLHSESNSVSNESTLWSVAFQNGALVTAGTLQTGQAYSDLNGISALTILGGEPNATQEILVTTTLAAVMSGITVSAE